MKDKGKLIGLISGIILTAVAGAAGIQSDEFKAGLCGMEKPSVQVPMASPSPSVK